MADSIREDKTDSEISEKSENNSPDSTPSEETQQDASGESPQTKPYTPNPFAAQNSSFSLSSRGILKPPQFNLNNTPRPTPSRSSFVLNPSRLSTVLVDKKDDSGDGKEPSQSNGEVLKFVPLLLNTDKTKDTNTSVATTNTTQPATSSAAFTSTSSSAFVFGQNLQDRVIEGALTTPTNNNAFTPSSSTTLEASKPSTSLNGTNGDGATSSTDNTINSPSTSSTSENLFSAAINSGGQKDTTPAKSLSESAREYEASRAVKRKYEEVEVVTGEEGETNILNLCCKLFAFDKAGGWQERGRGTLRLNDLVEDKEQTQSRLVFRTSGSLRVIINTKIWAEMTVEKASEKSVRFTALDSNGEIKVFLAMASLDDSKQLFDKVKSRVENESQKHKKLNSEST